MASFHQFRQRAMQENPMIREMIGSKNKIIANLFIASRFNKTWTQEELAKRAQLSLDDIIAIESGLDSVPEQKKLRVMQLLDITTNDLSDALQRYSYLPKRELPRVYG